MVKSCKTRRKEYDRNALVALILTYHRVESVAEFWVHIISNLKRLQKIEDKNILQSVKYLFSFEEHRDCKL